VHRLIKKKKLTKINGEGKFSLAKIPSPFLLMRSQYSQNKDDCHMKYVIDYRFLRTPADVNVSA